LLGWNNASGHLNLYDPTTQMLPSGKVYYTSLLAFSLNAFNSASKSKATHAVFSLISLTISLSADDENELPYSSNNFIIYSVKSLPAKSILIIACGKA